MLKIKTSCFDCNNTSCLIKANCPPHILEEVDKNKTINRIRKKQIIFQEGDEPFNIYFIYSGIVKVFKKGAFNKDQIVRFSFEGDILGHRGLNSSNNFPVSAQAISDTEICCFSKDFFLDLLNKVPQLAINLMLFFSDELNQEETKLRDMAIFNVREKVAKTLLIFIDKFGINQEQEIFNIEILTRQDIADFTGLTSNQVTKELSELKQNQFIDTYNKKIKILSKEKIERIVSFLT
ncbi:MAG: Crp/Fnr family transcriptional regulator [Flavobacteriales bacterium]|nr:Crp/Fnr family transcriptional regulator [Flavobacteriales bacterium]